MASIVFINRYFFPDYSATSQLLSDLAFDYATKLNRNVAIVTSRQIYDDPQAILASLETIRGVTVYRVWTARFGRGNLLGRALDYFTFYISSAVKLFSLVKKGDVVVAKTDPPLISVVAAIVVKLRGAILVNWVQDLFPEVATQLGLAAIRPIEYPVRRLRNWSLRVAKRNIVLGELMKTKLLDLGVHSSNIEIIHNWTDEVAIVPISRDENEFVKAWGLEDKFVVAYSGNLGRAHEYETILGAAEQLSSDFDLVFLFIGGGALFDDLKKEVVKRNLQCFIFKPYQKREDLSKSLSIADVHMISLRPELEGSIVPSKLYGVLAVGKPIIFVGSENGEIARFIKENDVGRAVGVGKVVDLVESISFFYGRPQELGRVCRRARDLVESKYSKESSLEKWREVLASVDRSYS